MIIEIGDSENFYLEHIITNDSNRFKIIDKTNGKDIVTFISDDSIEDSSYIEIRLNGDNK